MSCLAVVAVRVLYDGRLLACRAARGFPGAKRVVRERRGRACGVFAVVGPDDFLDAVFAVVFKFDDPTNGGGDAREEIAGVAIFSFMSVGVLIGRQVPVFIGSYFVIVFGAPRATFVGEFFDPILIWFSGFVPLVYVFATLSICRFLLPVFFADCNYLGMVSGVCSSVGMPR